jgi:hypothetical protein
MNQQEVGKLKFYQINFGDDGYDPKVCTLSDVLQDSETYTKLNFFPGERFDSMDRDWGICSHGTENKSKYRGGIHYSNSAEEGTGLDCKDNQFHSKKNIPVFDMMKRIYARGSRPEILEEHKATIVWNFERGFEVIETPSIEELDSIEIPGGNRIEVVERPSSSSKARFLFSNKASEFGDTKSIVGILPDGDNLPEPRFPRTMQELEFREDTKRKISNLEGQIEELWGMFRDHVRSHD